MKDKWLDDIHDRMAGFETDEPDNLWADLQKRLEKRRPSHLPHYNAATCCQESDGTVPLRQYLHSSLPLSYGWRCLTMMFRFRFHMMAPLK